MELANYVPEGSLDGLVGHWEDHASVDFRLVGSRGQELGDFAVADVE